MDKEFGGHLPAGFLISGHLQDAAFGRRQRVEVWLRMLEDVIDAFLQDPIEIDLQVFREDAVNVINFRRKINLRSRSSE